MIKKHYTKKSQTSQSLSQLHCYAFACFWISSISKDTLVGWPDCSHYPHVSAQVAPSTDLRRQK